ncbi:MAG: PIN domain-containing protein, partial [Acidobacteria bacterium]|nr:PIN domain-containing protein [Acidobacteriota bacterium]
RQWAEVAPAAVVRARARTLLSVHALRAADALQLAAAITAAQGEPQRLPFVCLDDRLRLAAAREGFRVLP